MRTTVHTAITTITTIIAKLVASRSHANGSKKSTTPGHADEPSLPQLLNTPANPNGSSKGITGLTNRDGRFTIMMPHPERVFRSVQHSWHPDEWGEDGP